MLQKSSILNTLDVFFEEPTRRHSLIDISRKISLAHTSVKKNIKGLIDLGFIKKEIETKGTRKFPVYIANRSYKRFTQVKKINNLDSLLKSGLVEFLEEKLMPKCIVVFGSYSKGEDIEESDIDLFIQAKEKKLILSKYEKLLNRELTLFFEENFSRLNKELKNNILNGIVMRGYIKVF